MSQKVENPEHHPGTWIGITAPKQPFRNSSLTTWAESFIFAGLSAVLLLVANLFSHYWYFSFFALTPFLYRIIKATPVESLRLGFLLGLSFFGVSVVDSLITSPLSSLLMLLSGTGLFALFGWCLGWARQRWGFNPSLVALLWVGLETGLIKLGLVGGLIGGELSSPFLHSLIGLFGFITVSALIVLLNSLLALVIVKIFGVTGSRNERGSEAERTWNRFFTRNLLNERVYLVPEGRAPP